MKEAVKKSAGSSGIMTINKNIAADVDKLLQKYINDALAQGVDLDTLGPEQLKMIVAMNSKATNRVISGSSPEGKAITEKLFGKKGEVVDMTGKKIDTSQGIMGGKSVKELMESGQVQKGTDNIKISEKITDREMFKEANKKFNKTDVVADTIARITSMEPVAALKEANKIIGRKGIYKNLDETQSKKILQDTEDWIFQRDPADRYDYKNNRPFRDDPNFDPDDPDFDPEQGFYTGGMVDVEPNLSDIGHGSDALMARTRLVSPDGQATTSTGLNYLLAEDNDNIRVPFAGGESARYENYYIDPKTGELKKKPKLKYDPKPFYPKDFDIKDYYDPKPYYPPDIPPEVKFAEGGRIGFQGGGMGRRAFLKLLAALGGGIAGIKTGILGLGGKETGKQVAKEVVKSAGSGKPPPYFFRLVEKIKFMGDETMATQDKTIAKKYKDYVMEEDFAGNVTIVKKNMDDPNAEEVIMSYKVDDVNLPSGKGMAKVDEYEEFTVKPDKDIEPGVPDEVIEEAGDTTAMTLKEKAEGGRIGFSGGGGLLNVLSRLGITGSSRRFLEKTFGKDVLEQMIKDDPDMHRGLLEVVQMFRNRDKEGLKMYMQKFLPHMDDETVEEFIIGSTPDVQGIRGQLIRLGSGRDYAQKLEMMKRADQVKKLENFDIKNVTKNAEGGRIELKGGGDALKALINHFAKEAGKKGSDQLRDINPKALGSGIANIMGPKHLKMLKNNQTDYLESLLNIIKSDKKFLNNLKANTDEAIAQAPIGMEDFAKKIVESMKQNAMKGSRFERMKVYDKIDIDDAIVDVEQMIKNRRVKESDGRALNASGGLQSMLGE